MLSIEIIFTLLGVLVMRLSTLLGLPVILTELPKLADFNAFFATKSTSGISMKAILHTDYTCATI